MTTGSDSLEAKALALFESSLDQPSRRRAQWIIGQTDNAALRDKALKYLSRDESGSVAFNTGGAMHDTLDDTAIPDQIGAYRITGLIGRGGMGSVYRGERASGDFDHDVAIKVVRPGAMSDKLVERFQTERQTLAKLIHPHIARLYDGGTLESGAPYIVMEFIDGLPITDWADKENLPQDQRLKLFQDVCAAVGYAHQNLIIHRDITPSNVLVDQDGNVKLIDFGIAKPFDEDAAVTDMAYSLASMSFTPGFAAPERSKGAGANTLSDIYSLGKLLGKLFGEASDTELNAITAKATSLEPSDRHGSVDGLIDDLENFKNNYPVEAVNGGRGYRFKKFITRQKVGVTFAALAMTALVGGLVATTVLYRQAETARQSADQRFSETRELTGFLINELSSDLRHLPGTLPIIEKINETSSKYLDVLATASETDPSVMLDYAKGLAQLGGVMSNSGGANLGTPEEWGTKFEKSLELLRALEIEDPDNVDLQYALADVLTDYSHALLFHRGEFETANKMFLESQQYFDRVIKQQPNNVDALALRARSKLFALNYLTFASDEPIPDQGELRGEFESLVARFPDHKRIKPYYASFLNFVPTMRSRRWRSSNMAPITLGDRLKYDESVRDLILSSEIFSDIIAEEPMNTDNIYQFIRAVRELTVLREIHTSWMPTDTQIIEAYSDWGERTGRSGIEAFIQTDDKFKDRRKIEEELGPLLNKSDTLLRQIEPFETGTFTYIYADFYNLKARSIYEAKYRLDLDAAEGYTDQALAIAESFMKAQPDFRNATLETAVSLTEKSYLNLLQQSLFGDDKGAQICRNLSRAKTLWVDGTERWGEIIDYKSDLEWTSYLFEKAGCE